MGNNHRSFLPEHIQPVCLLVPWWVRPFAITFRLTQWFWAFPNPCEVSHHYMKLSCWVTAQHHLEINLPWHICTLAPVDCAPRFLTFVIWFKCNYQIWWHFCVESKMWLLCRSHSVPVGSGLLASSTVSVSVCSLHWCLVLFLKFLHLRQHEDDKYSVLLLSQPLKNPRCFPPVQLSAQSPGLVAAVVSCVLLSFAIAVIMP